ncbi:hypothetical protein FHU29_000081 [Hoyosella altamirensis]|uniref:Uncharacterized protein n=1 Tax=Hoyosella altamirensis TaxID=616997 RepID=A0A839RGY6_9ACTN|nr:hypothetical protein [Hoyosella altamirensis]
MTVWVHRHVGGVTIEVSVLKAGSAAADGPYESSMRSQRGEVARQ